VRYKIDLTYNGSEFYGWQRQENVNSVQQTIEDAFFLIFKEKIELIGCGRTDTGVHAKIFTAHFDSEKIFNENHVKKLNRYLPNSISIFNIFQVCFDFHARFSAKNRTYQYWIYTTKNPFYNKLSWYIPQKLDIEKMQTAANKLYNYTDFTSFSKLHTDVKNNNCEILKAEFIVNQEYIVFEITANRFLRNMVRAIVGTLVEVGKGKISIENFEKIIESKNRQNAGQSAPAEGLFLIDIEY